MQKKMQQQIYVFLDNLIWIDKRQILSITTRILVVGSQRVKPLTIFAEKLYRKLSARF